MSAPTTTIPDMGKKKPDAHQGLQIPVRVDDPRLVAALNAIAKDQRRSRNVTILILLEQALQAAGYWPWPRPEGEEPKR